MLFRSYRVSDIAHEVNGAFQRTTKQILAAKPSAVFMQMHGFAKGTGDPDLILGNGTNSTPVTPNIDYLISFKNNLYSLDNTLTFKVAHIDVSWTRLTGTTNTQGRYINGVSSPCNTAASTPNGRFLHVEQAYTGLRDNSANWQKVATAIANTFATGNRDEIISEQVMSDDISYSSFNIYPNPAVNSLSVESEWFGAEVTVTNVLGKVVLQRNVAFSDGKSDINISALRSGIYFLRLKNDNANLVRKFIKQ